jgi:cbb3-type cytochrome oxidase maturation protein
MSVIYIVLPAAIVLAGVALAAFFWAVHRGQFDDLDTPAHRMLLDDDAAPPASDAPRRRRRRG